MDEEIWKDVIGFEEYFQISNHGRVWSKRTSGVLKQGLNKKGYPVISSKIGGRSGNAICKRVHRWVAEAFIENSNQKLFVNHVDGDKTNNHYLNLEWVTNSENIQHAYSTGLNKAKSAREHHASKLTDEDIEVIKSRYIPYCKINGCRALANEYGVSHAMISRNIRRVRNQPIER